jgi:RNA polymerase sigma-70 factor (ECF subfamily)
VADDLQAAQAAQAARAARSLQAAQGARPAPAAQALSAVVAAQAAIAAQAFQAVPAALSAPLARQAPLTIDTAAAEPLELDPRQIVRRCRLGEEAAFSDLVSYYSSRVLAFCLRFLRQRQDAEDAAQETLARACRYLPRFDESREFEPWLLAIASNRCRTALAARRRRPAAATLMEHPEARTECLDGALDGAAQWDLVLKAAMQSLRSEYRDAFVLFHVDHLSYAEIAERLEVPIGTVKTWVHRARRELTQVVASARAPLSAGGDHGL